MMTNPTQYEFVLVITDGQISKEEDDGCGVDKWARLNELHWSAQSGMKNGDLREWVLKEWMKGEQNSTL